MRSKRESPQIDKLRLEEFTTDMDRLVREAVAGLDRHLGYPFDQIGTNLRPFYTTGRLVMMAAAAGVPKSRVMTIAIALTEFIDSLYTPDPATHWRAASIAEQEVDNAFDLWQVTAGSNATAFELRRGLSLALAQRDRIDVFINATRIELANRQRDKHAARRRLNAAQSA